MARNIIFLGIKHCGKSTQGRLLAARLGREFIDTDELLTEYYVREYAPGGGDVSPRKIMQQHGEEFFRKVEAGAIRQLLSRNNEQAARVVALGGGAACNIFLSDEEIKSLGVLVHLVIPPEKAYMRIAAGGIPPFLAGDDPFGKFTAMAEKRMKRYEEISDMQIHLPCDVPAEDVNVFIYRQLIDNGFLKQ